MCPCDHTFIQFYSHATAPWHQRDVESSVIHSNTYHVLHSKVVTAILILKYTSKRQSTGTRVLLQYTHVKSINAGHMYRYSSTCTGIAIQCTGTRVRTRGIVTLVHVYRYCNIAISIYWWRPVAASSEQQGVARVDGSVRTGIAIPHKSRARAWIETTSIAIHARTRVQCTTCSDEYTIAHSITCTRVRNRVLVGSAHIIDWLLHEAVACFRYTCTTVLEYGKSSYHGKNDNVAIILQIYPTRVVHVYTVYRYL